MSIVYTNTTRILPVVVCILPTVTDRIEGFYPAQRAVLIVILEGHTAGPKYCPPSLPKNLSDIEHEAQLDGTSKGREIGVVHQGYC